MDALSVLRDFTARNDIGSIKRVGSDFCFGDDYRFPCATVTGYRAKNGVFYTLDSLVFFVQNAQLKHSEYMQQALTNKVQLVTFTDRKPLLDYLEGKVLTSDHVELVPPPLGGGDGLDEGPLPKRQKAEQGSGGSEAGGEVPIHVIRALERPVRDRDTILLCPNKSFDSILAILTRRDKLDVAPASAAAAPARRPLPPPPPPSHHQPHPYQQPQPAKVAAANAAAVGRKPGAGAGSAKVVDGAPIILVPNASQTLLNTYNAKEFLEEGVYVPVDVKAKSGASKPELLVIHRKMGRDPAVKYEVRDKPSSLSAKDWERVVAVFVLGKEWQFKDWPFKDHVEIFNKILGVFLRFEDDSMESVKVVMQWNVKIISLSKHKRHQDRTAVLEFWDKLDALVRARRLNIVF